MFNSLSTSLKSVSTSLILRGVLAVVVGVIAFAAFQAGETAGTRALFIIAGLVSVAFGVVVFARPGLGAATVALLFGLYSFICGISLIPTGIDARRTGKTLHQVTSEAA